MEKTGRNRGQISTFKIVALVAMKELESDPNYPLVDEAMHMHYHGGNMNSRESQHACND